MPQTLQSLLMEYIKEMQKIYGNHLQEVILYGSYARGDYHKDSDIDIMILVDMSDLEAKEYQDELFDRTYDFNMDHNLDIKPIAKSEAHFKKWLDVYPFYSNVRSEGVRLFGAA